jgi:hypothetical protein
MLSSGMNSSGSESVGMNSSGNERNPEKWESLPDPSRRSKCRSKIKAGGQWIADNGQQYKGVAAESRE